MVCADIGRRKRLCALPVEYSAWLGSYRFGMPRPGAEDGEPAHEAPEADRLQKQFSEELAELHRTGLTMNASNSQRECRTSQPAKFEFASGDDWLCLAPHFLSADLVLLRCSYRRCCRSAQ